MTSGIRLGRLVFGILVGIVLVAVLIQVIYFQTRAHRTIQLCKETYLSTSLRKFDLKPDTVRLTDFEIQGPKLWISGQEPAEISVFGERKTVPVDRWKATGVLFAERLPDSAKVKRGIECVVTYPIPPSSTATTADDVMVGKDLQPSIEVGTVSETVLDPGD